MNLTEITLAKITELGLDKSAEYFGIKRSTVVNWTNTKKIPASAAQRVLDEAPPAPLGDVAEAAPQDLALSPEDSTGDLFAAMVRQRLDDLNKRVTNLEYQRKSEMFTREASGQPTYGFTGGAPETVMVPSGPKPSVTTQSQVVPPNPNQQLQAVPQQQPTTPLLNKPYLPDTTGGWARPWPSRDNRNL
jgi:hypothetical protein